MFINTHCAWSCLILSFYLQIISLNNCLATIQRQSYPQWVGQVTKACCFNLTIKSLQNQRFLKSILVLFHIVFSKNICWRNVVCHHPEHISISWLKLWVVVNELPKTLWRTFLLHTKAIIIKLTLFSNFVFRIRYIGVEKGYMEMLIIINISKNRLNSHRWGSRYVSQQVAQSERFDSSVWLGTRFVWLHNEGFSTIQVIVCTEVRGGSSLLHSILK